MAESSSHERIGGCLIGDNFLGGSDSDSVQELFSLRGLTSCRLDLPLNDSSHDYDFYPTIHSSVYEAQREFHLSEQYTPYYPGQQSNLYTSSGLTVAQAQLHAVQINHRSPLVPSATPRPSPVNQPSHPSRATPLPSFAPRSAIPQLGGTPHTYPNPISTQSVQSYYQPSYAAVARAGVVPRTSQQGGSIIPQRLYTIPRTSRRQEGKGVYPWESITFSVHNRIGISVKDAFEGRFSGLDGRDDPMFVQGGTSVSLRFEWPGYKSWNRQIKTKDWRKVQRQITRAKLATEVARKLARFIEEMKEELISEDHSPWRVGREFINLDRLVLVKLDRVARCSWQPQFLLIN